MQNRGAVAHKVGHIAPVASALKNFVSKNRDALGIVEFESALLSPARQIRSDDNHQLFLLAGAQVHREALDGQMLFDNFFGQLGNRAFCHNAASVENRKVIREFLAKIEILFHEQDGHGAFAAEQIEGGLDFVF